MRALLVGLLALLAAGCSSATPGAAPSANAADSALNNCRPGQRDLRFQGMDVRIRVPESAKEPAPAVMVLHGAGDTGAVVQKQSGMDRKGATEGFITVYPSAPGGSWSYTAAGVRTLNDLAQALGCVDHRRVYLSGFSRGSLMTTTVACSHQPRRFAAFGGVALTDYRRSCDGAPPAPWVYLHGTKDSVVSYTQRHLISETGRKTLPPGPSMKKWASHNGCRVGPTMSKIGSNAVLRRWTQCRHRAGVDFYTLVGGDHQWPFRERPNAPLLSYGQSWAGVGAGDVMWDFFRKRTLA